MLFDLNDVVAERGLDDAAHLALLEREGRVLKFFNHLPPPEPAEVSALRSASGVFGKLLRERGKIFARAHALQKVFGLLARWRSVVFGVGGDEGVNLRVAGLEAGRNLLRVRAREQSRLLQHDGELRLALASDPRSEEHTSELQSRQYL